MWRLCSACAAVMLLSVNCASAGESVYLTTSARIEKYGLGGSYTFITPYFTRARTTLFVSLTKSAASTNPQSAAGSQSKPVAPQILHAVYDAATAQIQYSVSCDLSSVLHKDGKDVFTVQADPPEFGGANTVIDFTPDTVTVKAVKKPTAPYKSATATDTSCPPAAGDTFTVAFGVSTVPLVESRAYLYWSKNAFFSDSVNVTADSNGMLSSSDSSSVQQITAILTELAQTAGTVLSGGGAFYKEKAPLPKPPTPRERCFSAIATLVKSGPYYDNHRLTPDWQIPLESDPDVILRFRLQQIVSVTGQASFDINDAIEVNDHGTIRKIAQHSGLVAFFPVPATATLSCYVKGDPRPVFLATPSTVNLYIESQFIDPQRDFLTNPTDTLTFNGGIITGHKYTDQSSAKTLVDTVTAPIRALIPSVSVQQTTQVQTGGGKPDQTTTTTQTTTGAPKSP